MIEAGERQGLGLAVAGHLLLFALLSIGLSLRSSLPPVPVEAMDVELVGPIGLRASRPQPATEAPAESQAPEQGDPGDASAPEPQSEPAPQPAPKADAVPAPKAKPAPQKPEPAKRDRLSSDFLKDIGATAAKEKAKGRRLGNDFLKGITPERTGGKGAAPRAAISGPQMAGLAAAIAAQVRPCYVVPLGGAGAERIVSTIRLRFNRNGSVVGTPEVVDHAGVSAENQSYVRQMDDAAKRAVLRCAPLRLPADLYEGGWEDIIFDFRPESMQ